jgi:integrase
MARQKGQGSIYQRAKGGTYYLQYKLNGKKKRVSLQVTHLKDKKLDGKIISGAESKARDILDSIQTARTKQDVVNFVAEQRSIIKKSKINFEDIWIEFEKRYKKSISSGSMQNYHNHWNNFNDWLNAQYPEITQLKQINEDIAKEYCSYLMETKMLSASTYNQHRGALLIIFNTLKEPAAIIENPWSKTERKNPKTDTISRKPLSDDEINKLLSYIDSDEFHLGNRQEWKILFYLGVYTGMRLVDCCMLKRDAINWEGGIISVVPQKTKRIRRKVTIPIFDPLKKILSPFICDLDKDDYVIPDIADSYQRYSATVKRNVVGIFEAAGFETKTEVPGRKKPQSVIGFHSLRGSLASKLLNSGVPVSVVKEIIGDNIKTIEDYYLTTKADDVLNTTRHITF